MSDYKFPLLMKSIATGLIVLAEGISSGSRRRTKFKGTVKGTGNGNGYGNSLSSIGDYREDWCLEVFEPFVDK